jgi:hypothetical protein
MLTVLTAIQKAVLILPSACSLAVDSLWMKAMVIHRAVYPQFYHRVMGRAQARFSTGLRWIDKWAVASISPRRMPAGMTERQFSGDWVCRMGLAQEGNSGSERRSPVPQPITNMKDCALFQERLVETLHGGDG